VHTPDYFDNSIVNLMASLTAAMGGKCTDYPPLAALGHEEIQRYKKVMLLVVDGMGHDHLLRHRPDGFLARHVRARITSVCPTTTASAITTFVSGKAPLQHGLTGWFTWLRELGAVTAVLPFRPRSGGPSYDSIGVDLGSILGWRSIFDAWLRPSYALIPAYIADSHFSRTTYGNAQRLAFDGLDDCLQQARDLLAREEELFLYAYWSELDRLGHVSGIEGSESRQHLAQLDLAIEQFAAGLAPDTLLLITADHGLVDSSPEQTVWLHEHLQLSECLALPLCGEPRLAFCYVHTDRQQQFSDYAQEHLSEFCHLMSREEMLSKRLFGLGNAHPEFHHRIGDYALIMKDRYIIKDRIAGEEDFTLIGVHGGLSDEELYVPLIRYAAE
jgi:predicted AlkP superfamily pyrophosphatase or phosphodiesterase